MYVERPRLQLQPRSVDATEKSSAQKSNRPNPFGDAKPVIG